MNSHSVLLTDLYQLTMMQGYFDQQMDQPASFEFFIRKLPPQRNFLIAAGLQQVVEYLEELAFTDEDIAYLQTTGFFHDSFLEYLRGVRFTGRVDAMPEGTIFFPGEPILRVTAPLPVAQLVETRIINILQFQSMIASKAARMRLVAPDAMLLDFGLRRAHGPEAGLLAARACYLAGLDGTATVLAGKEFGIPIFGTMAHSFVQAHESELEAFRHFADSHPDNLVLLIDTYDTLICTEKVVRLAEELKERDIHIKGVRIDSGDLIASSKAVRKILDNAGLEQVKIFLSSSLDEYSLEQIIGEGAPVDGFGIGTKMITSSDYSFLDCSYKLVEYNFIGRRKKSKSKETWPGCKQVFRVYDQAGKISEDILSLYSEKSEARGLIVPVMENGKSIEKVPSVHEARRYAAQELKTLPSQLQKITDKPDTAVELKISDSLRSLTREVDRRGH